MAHLLPTTALKQNTPSKQGKKMDKTAFNRNYNLQTQIDNVYFECFRSTDNVLLKAK